MPPINSTVGLDMTADEVGAPAAREAEGLEDMITLGYQCLSEELEIEENIREKDQR
jgi:hypothetical protein